MDRLQKRHTAFVQLGCIRLNPAPKATGVHLDTSFGHPVTERPVSVGAAIGTLRKKEHGVWVFQGEPANVSIPYLIDGQQEKRLRELTG